jgi:murein DD-endopeptidase MepM/ murein hydrolase activator NlpD
MRIAVAALCIAALAAPAAIRAMGSPDVAALQVALRARGFYAGPVDGDAGPQTAAAVRRLQRRTGIAVDGIAGPRTRAVLGRFARHSLGSRLLRMGASGWDVAELQFTLAWHGFPSGRIDGTFGPHLLGALRRFQRWAGIGADGRAGPVTLTVLRKPPPRSPLPLDAPVAALVGDRFGPRGDRFHSGVDFLAAFGTPVTSAAAGRVTWVEARDGWGLLVTVAHANGVRTLYAHLSRADVRLGQRVAAGEQLGLVGATGEATGPHLHFEVRVRGAAVDPLVALRKT